MSAFVRLQGEGAPPLLLKLAQDYGPDRLHLVVGDVLNELDLDRSIETSDVVISCMGAPKQMMSAENDFFERTAQAVVESMERNGTKRLIIVTAGIIFIRCLNIYIN